MKSAQRTLFVFLVILVCIGADQLTKRIVRSDLPRTRPVVLINGVLKLDYTDNRGGVFAFESLLPSKWRGKTVTAAAALFLGLSIVLLMICGRLQFLPLLGICLFCGGSLSNLVDRIEFGNVLDFVNLSVAGLQPYIFNLADVAIATGLTLAIFGVVIRVAQIVLH